MAYACPVCDELAPDGEHLAHHVAVVAMSRGGEHEAWLEETVPEWLDLEPEALGAELVEHVDEVEHELTDDPRASDAPGKRPPGGTQHGSQQHGSHQHGEQHRSDHDYGEQHRSDHDYGEQHRSENAQGEQPFGDSDDGGHPVADEPTTFQSGGQPGAERSIADVEAPFGGASADVSPETAEILEEARAMTEQRRSDDATGSEETYDATGSEETYDAAGSEETYDAAADEPGTDGPGTNDEATDGTETDAAAEGSDDTTDETDETDTDE